MGIAILASKTLEKAKTFLPFKIIPLNFMGGDTKYRILQDSAKLFSAIETVCVEASPVMA